jgi:hypothetical protein
MSRIQLEDNMMDVFMKMSDGNPGAMNVIMRIMEETKLIDPQSAFEGMGVILQLDELEIYADRIWMLFKDVCRENIVFTIGLLRAVQLGLVPRVDLTYAIDNRGDGLDVLDIMHKVRLHLTQFKKEN